MVLLPCTTFCSFFLSLYLSLFNSLFVHFHVRHLVPSFFPLLFLLWNDFSAEAIYFYSSYPGAFAGSTPGHGYQCKNKNRVMHLWPLNHLTLRCVGWSSSGRVKIHKSETVLKRKNNVKTKS